MGYLQNRIVLPSEQPLLNSLCYGAERQTLKQKQSHLN